MVDPTSAVLRTPFDERRSRVLAVRIKLLTCNSISLTEFFKISSLLLSSSSMASCLRLLLLLLAVSPAFSTNTEGEALHTLRSRLKDPNNVLQSWDPTLVNPCTWFHVTCNEQDHVVRLDLGNSGISGQLVPELGLLEHLQYLELSRNNFDGRIPEELGNLKNLVSMDLYDNLLEGEIPKSLGNLKTLRFLRLSNNRLTGTIPQELASLTDLRVFDVSNNDLCGTIPTDGPFSAFPAQRQEIWDPILFIFVDFKVQSSNDEMITTGDSSVDWISNIFAQL